MVKFYVTLLSVLVYVELYSVGVVFLAKKGGNDKAWKCLIPFFAFKKVNELTGTFKVLTIPVQKYRAMMIELFLIVMIAVLYGCWGDAHLTGVKEVSHGPLWQILGVVIGIMAAVAYFALLSSSKRLFRRFSVKNEFLTVLICVPVITVPFVYAVISRNPIRDMKDMY